jgi:membrane fusion protein, copper/silver efflux system
MNSRFCRAPMAAAICLAALFPLGCRGKTEVTTTSHSDSTVTTGTEDVAYYTCPMHPSIRSQTPGQCPICGMTLVAVTQEELRTGTITLTAERRQEIGVRTAPAERKPIHKTLRAVGRVAYDETRLAEVSTKIGGWIGRLYADATGMKVNRGSPLFTIYSPELYSAQEEYLTALRSQAAARQSPAPDRADYLVEAARNRLRLLDVSEKQLEQIAAAGKPIKDLPFLSPVTGYVIEKNVVAGASIEPKAVLFRIANLDRIWIEAEFYSSELELVKLGAMAIITFPYLPGQQIAGAVSYVYPYLDPTSRTGRVRIELKNPGLELKPDMYANVELSVDLGERLVVPKTAVLPAGDRTFVFLDLGEGRLRPQRVQTGVEADENVEIVSGLNPGDSIVTSGNFLIAAESRLKTALEQW